MGRMRDWLLGKPVERVEPLEGTRMSLYNSIIPAFWQQTYGTWYGTPQLVEQVWAANRALQLNAQQIARMPLEWHGPPAPESTPFWLARTPDPNWFPNGIGDALHAIVSQYYTHGFSCQYVTDYYATGFPRTWTVLPSGSVQIRLEDGRRAYKLGEDELNPERVVQIDRNPTAGALHGTPVLQAYGPQAYALLAAGNQSLAVSDGGIPQAILKPQQRVTKEQAEEIRENWMQAAASRGTAPAIIPPNLEFEILSYNPSDLALLETQEWNARVLATAFGVPAVLLNMSLQGGLTYQNPAALGEQWWRFELRPAATNIAQALSEQMLPAGQWVSFDAADTFAPITEASTEDDPQKASEEASAPTQQPGESANVVPIRTQPEVVFQEGAIQTPQVVVKPPQVHVEVHPGRPTRRTVTFSDGRKATINEEEQQWAPSATS